MRFRIPSKSDQLKILSILKNIDKKIELNCKLASELSLIAKDIYNSWFIQQNIPDKNYINFRESTVYKFKIPTTWNECKISDLISDFKQGDWGKEEKNGNNSLEVRCIRGTDMPIFRDGVVDNLPIRYILDKHNDRKLRDGDFVIEISGTPGRSTYINKNLLKTIKV